jgi:hypothetical protein
MIGTWNAIPQIWLAPFGTNLVLPFENHRCCKASASSKISLSAINATVTGRGFTSGNSRPTIGEHQPPNPEIKIRFPE